MKSPLALFSLLIVIGFNYITAAHIGNCSSLPIRPDHVVITCIYPGSINPSTCDKSHFPSGTVVRYDCAKFFNPVGAETRRREISCVKGKWRRLGAFMEFNCNYGCGQPTAESVQQPLIVFGKPTERNRWPWHAAIFRVIEGTQKFQYICGGTLISSPFLGRPSSILTGAHCLTDTQGKLLNSTLFKVVLGAKSSDINQEEDDTFSKVFTVKSIVLAPDFDIASHEADLGVVHLSQQVEISDYILPVCFPYANSREFQDIIQLILSTGNTGEVVGFGINEFGNVSQSLRYAELPVLSPKQCYDALDTIPTFNQFCAGFLDENHDGRNPRVCRGDSGGGFVMKNIYSPIKRYFIFGVVSFGRLNPDGAPCQNVAVFTRVHKLADFVTRTIELFEMFEANSGLDSEEEFTSQSSTTSTLIITTTKLTTTPTTWSSTRPTTTTVLETQERSTSRRIIQDLQNTTTYRITKPVNSNNNERLGCPPLNAGAATVITCHNFRNSGSSRINTQPVDCLNPHASVPHKTVATLKCKRLFKLGQGVRKNHAEMTCQTNGQWSEIIPKNFNCVVDCGTEGGRIGDIISGKYNCPASVGLFYEDPVGSENYTLFCHATMIGNSRRALVSAAHCATRNWVKEERKIVALLGKFHRIWELNDFRHVQLRYVVNYDVHPGYQNTTTSTSDIAIFWLDKGGDITDKVRPMCLPKSNKRLGEYGSLIWGNPLNGEKKGFISKLLTSSPTLAVNVCKPRQPSRVVFNNVQKYKSYCDVAKSGISTCDIGGGGCVVTRSGDLGRWVIEGVVSPAAVGLNGEECFSGSQSIFIRFAYFRDWIDSILGVKDVEDHNFVLTT